MNNKMVEMTLNRIIEIDNIAIDIKTKIKDVEEIREKELRKLFKKMEFEVMHTARKEAKNKYDAVIEEAKDIEKKVNEDKDREEENLKKIIETCKEKLVEELFEELF